MKHLVLLPILFLAVVGPAAADEKDAETRFHEAYVQEVIDGQVAAAAKTYLALLEDEETSLRIRSEARFRLAVCAVLLGRADEGRTQLAVLLADDATPPVVRTKAKEYQASIAGLDVGSELDRKLQSLVFDLGREYVDNPPPAVYRDFQIIGEAATPFLTKLLDHPDEPIRRHAFRILCRMDADGMGRAWKPDIRIVSGHFCNDFLLYLKRRPQELPGFEQGLLALDDEALQPLLGGFPTSWFPFTPEFVTELVTRPAVRWVAIDLLERVEDADHRLDLIRELLRAEDPELRQAVRQKIMAAPDLVKDQDTRRTLLLSWLRSDDLEVVDHAADALLERHDLLPDPLDRDLYESLVSHARRSSTVWSAAHGDHRSFALVARSDAQPAGTALEVLSGVVDAGLRRDADGTRPERRVVTSGLAELLAASLERRPVAEVDLAGYAAVVKRWAGAIPRSEHLRWLIERLPQPDADALERWTVDEFLRQRTTESQDSAYHLLYVFEVEAPEDLRRWHAAFQGTQDEDVRTRLLRRLPRGSSAAAPELQRAIVRLLPELIREVDDEQVVELTNDLPYRTAEMDSEEAVKDVTALIRAVLERPESVRADVYDHLAFDPRTNGMHEVVDFVTRIWPRVVRRVWTDLPAADRERCLASLYGAWTIDGDSEIAAFLREHLGEPGTDWELVAQYPEAFPLTTWVPLAPAHAISYIVHQRGDETIFTAAETDAAARELTRDATKVNRTIMAFVATKLTPEVKREIVDRLLASGSAEARGLVLARRNLLGWLSPQVKGLEAALDDLLAEEEPDLYQLRIVASALEPMKPTKKLIPAAKILLGSASREDVLAGIRLAESLASQDLRPELQQLYMWTLDSRLRTPARDALRVIDHLAAVQSGAKSP